MKQLSFKEWYLKAARVEGECNCWLHERFEDMITSNSENMIEELLASLNLYQEYYEKTKLETYTKP